MKNLKNKIKGLDEDDSEIISEMEFIDDLLEKIREYEKFVNHWYKDGNGFWTLGYGHKKTLNDTVDNRKISEQQALDLFNNDVNSRVGTFLNATPNWQKFDQSELDVKS